MNAPVKCAKFIALGKKFDPQPRSYLNTENRLSGTEKAVNVYFYFNFNVNPSQF